jgi:hypothetical protein
LEYESFPPETTAEMIEFAKKYADIWTNELDSAYILKELFRRY